MVTIDTPAGIALYQLDVHRYRLKVEIATGMRSGVNTLQGAQHHYSKFGCNAKTRKKMLTQLNELRCKVIAGEVSLLGNEGVVYEDRP